MKKTIFAALLIAVSSLGGIKFASAHAVVSPNQANIGEFTNFSLGVPSERASATVSVRLLMPAGLNYVTPFVKPGWKIEVKKNGDQVQEIDWTGGAIPTEEKDQFMFSAQIPTTAGTLQWKVYQTYQDGTVISWDQDPSAAQSKDASGKTDFSKVGPYSKTEIVNDLANGSIAPGAATSSDTSAASLKKANFAATISIVALVFAIWALRKKNV
ncbi:MAG: nuclear export factor [Candidatus Doudnabacteria bacterium]|nr:nuclear export factor [Candidatus Doudnabacteria bacterium]